MQPNTNQTITDLQREIHVRRKLGQPTRGGGESVAGDGERKQKWD